jgi:hypothetical protein
MSIRPSLALYNREHPDTAKVLEESEGSPYSFGYSQGWYDSVAGFAPIGPLDPEAFLLSGETLEGYRDGFGDYQAELRYARGIVAAG